MPKLLGVDKWIEQIDGTLDRLAKLDCDKCIGELLDRMVNNNIISEWKYSDGGLYVEYRIDGKEHQKEL